MTTATRSIPINAELLERAEHVARARNMSVEAYLERLLRIVTQPPPEDNELGPITRKLKGILPPMTDEEVRATLDEARMEKYGRR